MSMVWESSSRLRRSRLWIAGAGAAALVGSAGLGALVATVVQSPSSEIKTPAAGSAVAAQAVDAPEAGVVAAEAPPLPEQAPGQTTITTTGTYIYAGTHDDGGAGYCDADFQVLDVRGDDGSVVGAFKLGPEAYSDGPDAKDGSGNVCSYDFSMELRQSQTYTFTLNGRRIDNATYVGSDVESVAVLDMSGLLGH